MKLESIDVDEAIDNVKQLLEKERDLSPALKSALNVMLMLVSILLNRVTLNSKNSSKPPSTDLNRKKEPQETNETNGNQWGGNQWRNQWGPKPMGSDSIDFNCKID